MKANLPQKEPEFLKKWEEMNLYQKIVEKQKGRSIYLLHDGPPYANGDIHIGHALNKILKDFVVRSHNQIGFQCEFIPGWDCHGLPIEHQVDKKLGPQRERMEKIEIRKECRAYAKQFIEIQKREFQRLGVIGEWENPYLTMTPDYEATIVREFGKMVRRGGVYRGRKPIHWCRSCRTALAEAEVEYDSHRSPSIYVKFPVSGKDNPLHKRLGDTRCSFVIWTTTPWTLPANRAIAVHPHFRYTAVETDNEALIIAEELLEACRADLQLKTFHVRSEGWRGEELEGIPSTNPLTDLPSPVILGEHVHSEQGTGIVHTAPGHGQEDFEIGQRYGLEVYSPVDDRGRFTQEFPPLEGIDVFDANPKVIEQLQAKGALLPNRTRELEHSYPHCWRCKNPVLFRATPQWFLSMETNGLRREALKEIERVRWIPRWGHDRIQGMLENRPDWCLSRQRAWGVPIIAFHCQECHAAILNPDWIESIAQKIEAAPEGSDIWFSEPLEKLLPQGALCPKCQGNKLERETNILDVWFDSGVSFAAVVQKRFPQREKASLYLEGSDQHRGWFQSALLTAIGTGRKAPYEAVLTHGFVVDGEGHKMSKSLGNVISPDEVVQEYGAEILRLWVAAEDYSEDIRISPEILRQLSETYRRIRNTCRYLLGNLFDFDPRTDRLPYKELEEIDQFLLHRLYQLLTQGEEAYRRFQFHKIYHSVRRFCVADLSAFYLDILKDRLYTSARTSNKRRAAQTAIYDLLVHLIRLIAPILPFTMEEVWSAIPNRIGPESIHLAEGGTIDEQWKNEELAQRWGTLLQIRSEVLKPLENARKKGELGSSLEAKVTIKPPPQHENLLHNYLKELPALFIVSQVDLATKTSGSRFWRSEELPELEVRIDRAKGEKCMRCWNYSETVGSLKEWPDLCDRCFNVVKGIQE